MILTDIVFVLPRSETEPRAKPERAGVANICWRREYLYHNPDLYVDGRSLSDGQKYCFFWSFLGDQF